MPRSRILSFGLACALAVLACLGTAGSASAKVKYTTLKQAGVTAGTATLQGNVLRVPVRVRFRTEVRLAVVIGRTQLAWAKATLNRGTYRFSGPLSRTPEAANMRLRFTARVLATGRRGRELRRLSLRAVPPTNAPPSAIGLTPATVVENAAAGTAVGQLTATDADAGQGHAFALVAGAGADDNAAFAIVAGQLVTTAPLDFEAKPTRSIRVRATDPAGANVERTLAITVQNANDAPTSLTLARADVDENQPAGAPVGLLSSTDPEVLDAPAYTLVPGPGAADNELFAITGTQLRTAAALDREAAATRSIRVRVDDGRGGALERPLTITVNDVNEAPAGLALSGATVAENAPAGTSAGTLAATDVDAGDTRTYALVAGAGDADNALFAVDGTALRTTAPLDFEAQPTRSVRVRVTDARGASAEEAFTIAVTDQQDPPRITTASTALAFTENGAPVLVDGGLTVADDDDTSLESATVALVAGAEADDVLAFTNQNGITGAYSAGVLTLTGTSTVANYQAALRSVTYRHTGDDPAASKTVRFTAGDGDATSAPATRAIAVTRVADAPTVTTTSGALAYPEDSGALAADPGVTVTDPDSAQLEGATVRITSGFDGAQDELAFADQLGITGTYDDATGTLTLSGTAARTSYQAALRTVTYANTSNAPAPPSRTLTFAVTDAEGVPSAGATRTVSLTASNDAATVTTTATALAYAEDDAATAVDGALTVADPDDADLTGARVEITAGLQGDDELAFADQNGITGAYAAGVLTLTGTATRAQYEAALRSVTYRHAGEDPVAAKTVAFRADDGDGLGPASTRTIAVTAADDAPTLIGTGGTVGYTENATAVAVDPGIAASDPDSATLTGATVAITAGFGGTQDVLAFADTASITGSYDAATGVLTLTGAASPAAYAAALGSVTYRNASDDPATAARTVTFRVSDGTTQSTAVTRGVTVTAVNDAPVAADDAAATTEDAAVDTVDVRANDTDAEGGALTVTAFDDAATDGTVTQKPGGVFGYDPGSAYQQLDDGEQDTDTFTYTVADPAGAQDTADVTVTVTGANDAPVAAADTVVADADGDATGDVRTNDVDVDGEALTAEKVSDPSQGTVVLDANGTFTYTAGPSPSVSDSFTYRLYDGTAYSAVATVTILFNQPPVALNDAYTVAEDVPFSASTGVLSNDTDAEGDPLTAVLQTGAAHGAVTLNADGTFLYTPEADYAGTDAFTYRANDGSSSSNVATVTLTVTGSNDAPRLLGTESAALAYAENAPATPITATTTVSDVDSADFAGGTLTVDLSAGATSADRLAIADGGSITVLGADVSYAGTTIGTFTGGTGTTPLVVTLDADATPTAVEALVRAITYANVSDAPATAARTARFVLTDGDGGTSAPATRGIAVTASNDAPVLGGAEAATLAYTENAAATAISPALTVADADGDVTGATVAITANDAGAEDVLGFTDQNGITGSVSGGTLTLTGTASAATYQAALRSVTYRNTSDTPSTLVRTVTFRATDGDLSNTQARTITVTAVDDAPTVSTSGGSTAYTEQAAAVVVDGAVGFTDPDGPAPTKATVTIVSPVAGDELLFTDAGGITGSLTSGALTLQGTATAAQYEQALRSITFRNLTSDAPGTSRTIRFQIDAPTASNQATKTVAITEVNDPPVANADAGAAFTVAENGAAPLSPRANDTDPDDTTGSLVLDQVAGANVTGSGQTFTSAKGATVTIAAGQSVSYDPGTTFDALQAGQTDTDTFTYRVRDPGGATSNTATVTVTINGANDAPSAAAASFNGVANTVFELDATPADTAPKIQVNGTLKTGATDPDDAFGTLTVTAQTVSSTGYAGGNNVAIAADGTFTYVSEPGEGAATDTFTYAVADPQGASGTATVTINLRDRVWYVDKDFGGTSTGTSRAPFKTASAAASAAPANDLIFVRGRSGATPGAAQLKSGQRLVGQGEALNVALGATGTPNGAYEVLPAGSRPTLFTTGAAAVTLGAGAQVRSLNVARQGNYRGIYGTGTAGASITDVAITDTLTAGTLPAVELSGTTGTTSLANVDITTLTATGLRLANAGTVNSDAASTIDASSGPALDAAGTAGTLNLGSLSSSDSPTNGIALAGALDVSAAAGSIDTAAGDDVALTAGNGDLTYGGSITNTAGRAVSITGRTGGAIALSGAISESGTGISITSSSGATVAFSGAITASTGANTAFAASGGATVTATGAGSSLTTTTGAALNVSGATIGAAGLTFRSISANGGADGIVLANTGAGGLTVTGTGTTDGSGGTLQNITSRGVEATSTGPVTLKNMNLTNANTTNGGTCDDLSVAACNGAVYLNGVSGATFDNITLSGSAQHGIVGLNVAGFTLKDSTVTGAGNEVNENGVKLADVTGAVAITGSDLAFAATDNVNIINGDANPGGTASPVMNLSISGTTFRDTQTLSGGGTNGNGEGGVSVRTFDNGTSNIDIAGSSFLRLRTQGIQIFGDDSSTTSTDITGSTIDSGADIGTGIDLNSSATANYDFNVIGNPVIRSNGGAPINITAFDTSSMEGRVTNNPEVRVTSTGGVNGIRVIAQDGSRGIVEIDGNTVFTDTSSPIDAQARVASSRLDVKITRNTTTHTNALADINLTSGSSAAGEATTVCAQVGGAGLGNAASSAGSGFSLRTRVSDLSNTNRLYLRNFAGTVGQTWVNEGNTPSATSEATSSVTGTGVPPSAPPAPCAAPQNPLP